MLLLGLGELLLKDILVRLGRSSMGSLLSRRGGSGSSFGHFDNGGRTRRSTQDEPRDQESKIARKSVESELSLIKPRHGK